jgi:squalene/oxidosqualene cyclase-like protein
MMALHGGEDERAPSPRLALERGARALLAKQATDGSWEAEVVWSAMITAQFVLACHVMGRSIDPARRKRILRHFNRTRLPSGTWGLSEWSPPSLFVTTLVYVAARVLGAPANDPLLARALAFMRREDVSRIPSWGKFWLALMNLYAWEGVNPVSPEIWGMPRWLPIHPSRYYCHTRLIYMGMAALYGQRVTAPLDPLLRAIRVEIYPNGYEAVDFCAARSRLRGEDLYAPPSLALRASYALLVRLERVVGKERRARSLRVLRDRIRHELRTTSHASISPVSGLLNILALFAASGPADPDAERALEKLEDWIWEDDEDGMRVTGARSSTWDTSFAMLALAQAAPHADVNEGLARADRFLETQQIHGSFRVTNGGRDVRLRASEIDRIEPGGGFCFAGVWHGWPVSDCTAEAILAHLESSAFLGAHAARGNIARTDVLAAVHFILRTQNADGGFGSYEPRRTPFSLEWLNPAEMFGDSMTEGSYVECTASCIAALAAARAHVSGLLPLEEAIDRAVRCLRAQQLPSGAWLGVWGVRLVYGTLFGIRGLLAGGAPKGDPQIRRACAMLKAHQRADGSWGEAHVPAPSAMYREASRGQVIQTAWALSALLAAEDPDERALDRAAEYLAREQRASGDWEQAEPAGVFFHTALLEYRLYKTYFPVWALGQYETFRKRTRGRSRAD